MVRQVKGELLGHSMKSESRSRYLELLAILR